MCKENKKVLLGMSGGTDSSVAAMLLQDAGYEVTGVTFRFFDSETSAESLQEAHDLACKLGIKHLVYDAREIFKKQVIDYFIDEYMRGRTPVPCVICNNRLKWPLLAQIADENDVFHISTGHYVRREYINGSYYIRCAVDPDKDQSFFLWGLGQDILSRMVLPMGDVLKSDARILAAERGFERVSQKKDSIGVCFCPFDYHSFLRQYVPADRLKRGAFLDETGKFIAWHQGYPFYTIGQRRGLGIHLNRAVFVKEIRPETNEVVLAPLKALEKQEMYLKEWNIIDPEQLLNKDDVIVKIRYRKQENSALVQLGSDGLLYVSLHEPLTAVASGQAAAFYRKDVLLGGGIIV
ncbi:tRNA 2-thiouridine(34) synthase MnmA [Bacteroides sp. 224]|uniref:tRNA 2-thiouridine(34) synthase MnmA n=1 Tax=Bacteroides sp. 224 TaxID=2302936 RepID=UPI0013CFC47D|nr:tRNA 2-thiouridine(34) synthase MnmA [Bacteroides sp. 224]NDV67008.1 tRNA 2-thiouridine(34) synthase MnmA [Bacteroides sp. 224]